jgi:hypothetical protein
MKCSLKSNASTSIAPSFVDLSKALANAEALTMSPHFGSAVDWTSPTTATSNACRDSDFNFSAPLCR